MIFSIWIKAPTNPWPYMITPLHKSKVNPWKQIIKLRKVRSTKSKQVEGNNEKVPRARSIFKSNFLANWTCPITLARFMASFFKLINKSRKLGWDWFGLMLNFFTDLHLQKKKVTYKLGFRKGTKPTDIFNAIIS